MYPFYTLAELRHIEKIAELAGIDLMQRAARSIADWISQHYQTNCPILFACGTGNNSGDAIWAALNLHARDYPVTLLTPQPVKSPAALQALTLCKAEGIAIIDQLSLITRQPALLVDGVFGIGLDRTLSITWQTIIKALNELALPTLAIDTPSGLDAFSGDIYGAAIKATTTLTFLGDKPALHQKQGKTLSGHVIVDLLDLPKHLRPH